MSINPSEALGIYLNSSAKIYKLLNFKITRETEESHSLPSSKGDLAYWGLRMMVYLHMILMTSKKSLFVTTTGVKPLPLQIVGQLFWSYMTLS